MDSTCDDSNIARYKEWHGKILVEELDTKANSYEELTNILQRSVIAEFDVWKDFCDSYTGINQDFLIKNDGELFTNGSPPEICIKPYTSVVTKLFRVNKLNNPCYPLEPTNGWAKFDNCCSKFKDIFRTTIVVKYIDGVQYIIDELNKRCDTSSMVLNRCCDLEARDEGYYAAHFCVQIKTSEYISKLGVDNLWLEIQITTQLQDVIKKLLHKHYEKNRIDLDQESKKNWKWDFTSQEFSVNYLGHILHYLEGIIADLRIPKHL